MTSKYILKASDIRQSKEWAKYMQSIGWQVEDVGGVNAFIRKLPLLPYSMIKIEHPNKKIHFGKIDQLAKKHSTLAVVIEPQNLNFAADEYKQNGFKNSKLMFAHSATFKINLTKDAKKLWQGFSENARRNIKKAEDSLIVKESWDPESFFSLMKNLEKNKKIYTLPQDEYYKKINTFRGNSILLFAYPKKSNDPIAALWLSIFNGVVTYMQTGITDKGYQSGANYLLVWEGIKWAKKRGFTTWDFDAVFDQRFPNEHKKWRGFSEFKSRFHGEQIEYPHPQIKIYNIVFRLIYLWSTIFIR